MKRTHVICFFELWTPSYTSFGWGCLWKWSQLMIASHSMVSSKKKQLQKKASPKKHQPHVCLLWLSFSEINLQKIRVPWFIMIPWQDILTANFPKFELRGTPEERHLDGIFGGRRLGDSIDCTLLVVWDIRLFPYIGNTMGILIPIDELICFRGGSYTTNQNKYADWLVSFHEFDMHVSIGWHCWPDLGLHIRKQSPLTYMGTIRSIINWLVVWNIFYFPIYWE